MFRKKLGHSRFLFTGIHGQSARAAFPGGFPGYQKVKQEESK